MVKLLIAEDDRGIRELIGHTVPDGWDVTFAVDGIEALAAARTLQPDAIIMDHQLPVLTGAEVCDLLQHEPWRPNCTIVALTASYDPDVRRKMTAAGADAFLQKPFSPVELLDMLEVWEHQHG